MAIIITNRPDLERRVEQLAGRFGLRGRGRKTAVIECALAALEESAEQDDREQLTIKESIDRYINAGAQLREGLAKDFPSGSAPLSESLQRSLYDERGLPE